MQRVKVVLDRISDYLEIPELLDQGRRLRGKTGHIVCTSIYEKAPASFVEALTATFEYLGMKRGGVMHANCRDGYARPVHQAEVTACAGSIKSR